MPPADNATTRFSDRVQDYVRWRPRYPQAVWDILVTETGISAGSVMADIGSGTGISAELFLSQGCVVFGVEPNDAMRAAAESQFAGEPRFRSLRGTAEATGLSEGSVDAVVAAQAFHWFDPTAARHEFRRILKPGGWVILLWNTRRLDSTPFLRGYEALLKEFGADYDQIRHDTVDRSQFATFFDQGFVRHQVDNAQWFDRVGLRGRLMSSSYAPAAGHPRHAPMLAALDRLFDEQQQDGKVCFEYDTEVYCGRWM